MPFVELHNLAKHIVHLAEAVEAGLMVIESTFNCVKPQTTGPGSDSTISLPNLATTTPNLIRQQLRERLLYRKSLFQSTKLRLGSLQKRIDICINLAFNTVAQHQSNVAQHLSNLAQQDSKIMLRDSKTMKAIAAVTLCFLPSTAVASIMGSQLFLARDKGDGTWDVGPSPLFSIFWSVSVPFTALAIALTALWHSGHLGGCVIRWPLSNSIPRVSLKGSA